MLPDHNTISEQQENQTHNNEAVVTNYLDYASTNSTVMVQYKANNMILHIDSDTSYLSKPRA